MNVNGLQSKAVERWQEAEEEEEKEMLEGNLHEGEANCRQCAALYEDNSNLRKRLERKCPWSNRDDEEEENIHIKGVRPKQQTEVEFVGAGRSQNCGDIQSTDLDINQFLELNMSTYQELTVLEKSVSSAGSQLCSMAYKLQNVERCLDCCSPEDIDDLSMLELLESMHEVRSEYQTLRKDIQEVQQLQRDVSNTLRFQMQSMHQTYQLLRRRLELKAVRQ